MARIERERETMAQLHGTTGVQPRRSGPTRVSPRFHQTLSKSTRMKSIASILTVLAVGTMFATAAEEKKPAAGAAKPEAAAGAKPEGEKKKADPEAAFKKLDANNDGFLSLDEFKAGPA